MAKVNNCDEEILELRGLIGPRAINLPCAGVILIDAYGNILLEQRSDNSLWAFPAGYLVTGETFEEAAVRETLEETGISIPVESLVLYGVESGIKKEYENGVCYPCKAMFITRQFSGTAHPNSECLKVQFFQPDDVPPDDKLTRSTREIIKNLREHPEKVPPATRT